MNGSHASPRPAGDARQTRRSLALRVAYADVALRAQVNPAGGVCNSDRRVWQLRHDRVVGLGLTTRIVAEPASMGRCPRPGGEHLATDARTAST